MTKKFDLKFLADLTHCKLIGDPSYFISGVADLESATADDAAFLSNDRYLSAMKKSQAGVIFVSINSKLIEGKNYLLSGQPSKAFQQLVDILHPNSEFHSAFTGVHKTAVIHESVQLGNDVTVGPNAVIDGMVKIGAGTIIGAGVYIGSHSIIGENCLIHPNVVVREECIIGNRVILQPGVVIGGCGFGYITDRSGKHTKLNQVGHVHIEDDVEVGANSTIDRARFKSTHIGRGSKIDNLVQIGHGVTLGENNTIVAQTGIAGSTKTGKNVTFAGHVAVSGHIRIGDGVRVAGQSGISKSLTTGDYGGSPAVPMAQYNRTRVFLRHIESMFTQLKVLTKRLTALEKREVLEKTERSEHSELD